MSAIIVILITQLIFSITDLLARGHLRSTNLGVHSFLQPWFVAYAIIRIASTGAQFYVFTKIDLGKTVTLFSVAGIIFANILGVLFLKEILSPKDYIGVILAIISLIILSIK